MESIEVMKSYDGAIASSFNIVKFYGVEFQGTTLTEMLGFDCEGLTLKEVIDKYIENEGLDCRELSLKEVIDRCDKNENTNREMYSTRYQKVIYGIVRTCDFINIGGSVIIYIEESIEELEGNITAVSRGEDSRVWNYSIMSICAFLGIPVKDPGWMVSEYD